MSGLRATTRGAAGRAVGLTAVIVIVVLTTLVSPVSAHATLVRSDPAANGVLDVDPGRLGLVFTEPVDVGLSTVELTVGERLITTTTAAHPDEGSGLVAVFDEPLPDGVVVARWRVLSEADGHVTSGIVVFGVGDGADPSSAVFAEPTNPVDPVDALIRWLNLAALATVIGGAWTVARLGADGGSGPRERAARFARLGVVAALIIAVAQFAYQVAVVGGSAIDTATSLVGARWGLLWLARIVLLVAVAALLKRLRPGKPAPMSRPGPVVAALAAGIGIVQALSSHAAGVASLGWLSIASHSAHLVSAGVWVGGLAALLVALAPAMQHPRPWPAEVIEPWRAFARPALGSAAVLVATGTFLTGRHLTSLDAALRSSYGRVLGLKLVLVIVIAGLGLANWRRSDPGHRIGALFERGRAALSTRVGVEARSGSAPGRAADSGLASGSGPARRSVLGELGAALLVLGAAAVLTATPPAVGPTYTPAAEIGPDTRSAQAGDVLVGLSIRPNRPGQNLLVVQAASTVRPPPAPIERILARLSFDGDDRARETVTLEETSAGTWELLDPTLSSPGRWSIEVVVRRAGLVDQVAEFAWTVPVAAVEQPLISDRRWGSGLTGLALIVGLVAGLGAWAAGRERQASTRLPSSAVGAIVLVGGALGGLLLSPASASAHAELVSSDPRPCQQFDGAGPVTVVFSEEVDAPASTLRLIEGTDSSGPDTASGTDTASNTEAGDPAVRAVGRLDLDDLERRTVLFEPERPLDPGRYRLEWTVASAVDGDVESAGFGFAVGMPAAAECRLVVTAAAGGGTAWPATAAVVLLGAVVVALAGRLGWQLRRAGAGPNAAGPGAAGPGATGRAS